MTDESSESTTPDLGPLVRRCLFIDLELDAKDRIVQVGALLDERRIRLEASGGQVRDWSKLDVLANDADFVAGHNLIAFDQGHLRRVRPGSPVHRLPVIDTLCLAPLAFPEVPYHRLVKDYKQVRDSLSDPVRDSEISRQILLDCAPRFLAVSQEAEAVASLFRHALERCYPGSGFGALFGALGVPRFTPERHREPLIGELAGRGCKDAAERVVGESLARPAPAVIALAYTVAWIRVAGAGSVIPPWVRKQHPRVRDLVEQLRNQDCGRADCRYCRETHDPRAQLKLHFGHDDFRPVAGRDLQRQIVARGLGGEPLLAVLPTGAGKSLCYQLPAFVRHWRTGSLTIVISPLQALMKDQVDSLDKGPAAAALNGLLTPPERGRVLEDVRLGYTALLYVSPEQLRNRSFGRAIGNREIGCWVFDEAHCLSKWGHDFRPDYLYAGRFIREFAEGQAAAIPPVACFTATAKQDVKNEILEYFRNEVGQELTVIEAPVKREGLRFRVEEIPDAAKPQRVSDLLADELGNGSGIVFCATRRRAERFAEFLRERSHSAQAFHAGFDAPLKRDIQERFLRGEIQVICATNAFGMGIDKRDVRVVIHADVPGSLENYLQEAGRAGRDGEPAECILLFTPDDLETQFGLAARSEVSLDDIRQILRGLRRRHKRTKRRVVLTPGELLRLPGVVTELDPSMQDADTKVKTAVSWLERGEFLERNENHTRIFQGRPKVASMDEAAKIIAGLDLSDARRRVWLRLLGALFDAPKDKGLGVDDLAAIAGCRDRQENGAGLAPGEHILRTLHDMAERGLIEQGMQLTAFVRTGVKNASKSVLGRIGSLDEELIGQLRELAPDAERGEWQELSLRQLNQRLLDRGHEDANVEIVRRLIFSLAYDGAGELAGGKGSLVVRQSATGRMRVRLQRGWTSLAETAELRRKVAGAALEVMLDAARAAPGSRGEILVAFSTEDIATRIRADGALWTREPTDVLAAIDRALLFLHEQQVILLQHGLAVFRQAMTIRLRPERLATPYTRAQYGQLAEHYAERVFQIHVMGRYADLGKEDAGRLEGFVAEYFTLPKDRFVSRHLPGADARLAQRTSAKSFARIVTGLGNPAQQGIVAAPEGRNQLVLAGPGSGKTRVVVHRCAYLLRVKRVPARGILVVCFNRRAAWEVRKRLRALVGNDARGVTVQTYHGLAARILGWSFDTVHAERRDVQADLTRMVREAGRLLRGDVEQLGLERDEVRDRILEGYRHILVDEYQDIDEDQYELVAAIAKARDSDAERRLTIMAVGDDDQNIYTWRHASAAFIRRFEQDYGSEPAYLVDNYRSSKRIITAANAFIAKNPERMKRNKPIRIDEGRHFDPPGEPVRCLTVGSATGQAQAIVAELRARRDRQPAWDPTGVAILGRTHQQLAEMRHACEHEGLPVRWNLRSDAMPPLRSIREIARFLGRLRERRTDALSAGDLRGWIEEGGDWNGVLARVLDAWVDEGGEGPNAVGAALEFCYEALTDEQFGAGIGRGIYLSTIHAAKGTEFPHVYILDGGWAEPGSEQQRWEERRTFYVAMTRAMESLTIMRRDDEKSAHLQSLPSSIARVAVAPGIVREESASYGRSRRYTVLKMSDIHLSYAGERGAGHRIHQDLARLHAGSSLDAVETNGSVYLFNDVQSRVARLSRNASAEWKERLEHVESVRVVAMIERRREHESGDYEDRCRCDRWEVPVVEIAWRREG